MSAKPMAMAVTAGLTLLLSGCGIYHAEPIGSGAAPTPQTADALDASTNCYESTTAFETTVCASPALTGPYRAMTMALQDDLRQADIFGRDVLLAVQRTWLLGLDAACHNGAACIGGQIADHTRALLAWHQHEAAGPGPNALAQYVTFKPASDGQPGFCSAFARLADTAISRTGEVDPAAMGGREIAGTHGPGHGPGLGAAGGRRFEVVAHQANVFGLYQMRARALRVDDAPVIGPLSLTDLIRFRTPNGGGRFSAYASQTGDYGSMDAFGLDGKTLVLATDAWGFDTPAAPGEFAHAGLWDIGGPTPVPLCVFDTYQVPDATGGLADRPALAAWRGILARIRDAALLPLGTSSLRDQSQLRADADFVILYMPLLAAQQANAGGWTPWLRKRHDAVLDALFAWSGAAPQNKIIFDAVFAALPKAASELVRFYQQTQALTAAEARQASGLAVMELLYAATVNIDPGVGADLGAPADAVGYRPRYPILAAPT